MGGLVDMYRQLQNGKKPSSMKAELFRALERIGNLIVGNFTVSFQNELRFMVRARLLCTIAVSCPCRVPQLS